jgi:hypothetical protein
VNSADLWLTAGESCKNQDQINAGVGRLQAPVAEGEHDPSKALAAVRVRVFRRKPYFGKNEGDEPAEIIVFYAGIKDRPTTIEK